MLFLNYRNDGPGGIASRRRAPFIALFLAFATMLCAAFSTPAMAQTYRFGSIQIEGNQNIESRTIASYAGIARGESVSAAELNDAYQRILASGLFEDVAIIPRGNTLVIRVTELPTINVIAFEGNSRLRNEVLSGLVKSQARRVYSPSLAEADAATIVRAYNETGRLAARVEPRIIRRAGNRVDLVFEIAEGEVVEVERLSFVGNRAFTDRRLRQVLETKQAGLLRRILSSDTYVAERIEVDKQLLRDFYLARGYVDFQVLDATAEISRRRDGFFVTFSVREGLPFKFGQLTTISEYPEIDAEDFHATLRIRPGMTYSPTVLETAIARMEALALRRGISFLRVDPRVTRNDRDQTLDITFALVRGPRVFVERIDIEGNTTTLDQVVRRQFRTVEGDPFNPREIREAAERIRALDFFETANVDTRPGSSSDQLIIKADVEEKPTGSLTFGASYGKSDGVGGTVALSEANFLGRGQFVSLELVLGASASTSSFRFTEPAFLGRDLAFSFDALYSETEANFATYDTRIIRLSPSLEFPVSENGRLQVNYALGQARMFNVNASSSPLLAAEAATGKQKSSSIGYMYSWDNRRNGLGGTNVYVFRFSQDFGGLGGDLKFIRSELFAAAETRVLSEEVTLRATFEGGALATRGAPSRSTERFFLDGKIRGFEPLGIGPRDIGAVNRDALGGNMYAVVRFDAEFPIGLPEEYGIKGGAFFDVGSVWSLDTTAGTINTGNSERMRLRSTVGVALLWDTPIGPLRFNFSRPIRTESYDRKQSFDLTVSTRF